LFFVLSKTLDVLLSPLSWAILLLIAGFVRHRGAIPAWSPFGALAILVFFSLEPVSNSLRRRLEMSAQRTERRNVTYDAVVLLGGLVQEAPMQAWGLPSYNEHAERLLSTFDVLRTGHAKEAIVSGGAVRSGQTIVEARVLASQLEAWGIDQARIIVEDRARNTRENAEFSKEIIDAHRFKRLLVITSAEHMARALDCFHKVGLDPDALPVDYRSYDPAQSTGSLVPRAGPLADSTAAIRELVGRVIYHLVGYG
jgi:uncharacterized SAM-binding protein YcdF (DUF218 family)